MTGSTVRRGLVVAGVVVLAIGLAACGRRGPLEPPPGSSLPPAPQILAPAS